jgi:hypothetical protein
LMSLANKYKTPQNKLYQHVQRHEEPNLQRRPMPTSFTR